MQARRTMSKSSPRTRGNRMRSSPSAASRFRSALRAASALRRRLPSVPALAIQLGSGFSGLIHAIETVKSWPYSTLPGFVPARVPGHPGRLVLGRVNGVEVLVLSGRVHYYEGYDLDGVTFPVRVLAALGVRCLLLTNAAGGIHPWYRPGDYMILRDHINGLGINPLCGIADGSGFVDLSQAYDAPLRRLLRTAARSAGVRCREGVYLAVSGPSYETPAEIQAFARLGADAVGMSTVPEVIVARQCGLRVAAVSFITNLAAGRAGSDLSHAKVLAAGEQHLAAAVDLVRAFVRQWARLSSRGSGKSRNTAAAARHRRNPGH